MPRLQYSNILKRSSACFRSTTTANRLASGSTVHGGDPDVLENEKRRNLSGEQHSTSTTQEEYAPGWNEYLASASEANVKADRSGNNGPPTVELSERTIRHVKMRHHPAGGSRQEATYERDQVEGPLKTSTAGTVDDSTHEDVQTTTRGGPDAKPASG